MKNINQNYQNSLYNLKKTPKNIKLGLNSISILLKFFNNPQNSYKIFHIAGTNGKGSVCSFLHSMLNKSKLISGMFTSPHLNSIRERIIIQNKIINKHDFALLEHKVSKAALILNKNPSFFERILIIALLAFKKAKINIAILEVGLGGRLDATNIVQPIVCGISNIDLDHTNILGNTIQDIAYEKAGIIKNNTPIVIIQQNNDVISVIKTIALERKAPLTIATTKSIYSLANKCGITNYFQLNNLALAITILKKSKIFIKKHIQEQGIKNMYWPCRYELMQNNPKILFDGAHNPAAIKLLIKNISFDISFNKLPLFAVLGMSKDHNSLLFAKNWIQTNNNLLPKKLIITKSMAQRSIHPKKLIDSFIKYGFNVKIILNSFKALKIAIKLAKNYNGYVLVTGSLYLVGELRTYFKHVPCDPIQPKY